MRTDPRLFYFSVAMPRSTGSHSVASRVVRKCYGIKCLFCGETNDVSLAHLVAGNIAVDYSAFGKSNGYRDDLDVKSPRNFIPLCGSLGKVGTCHDAFDKHLLTMLFNPMNNLYRVISFNSSFAKHAEVNNKELSVPEKCRPYTRLLTWRARKCLFEHGYRIAEDISTVLTAVNLSDESKAGDSKDDAEVDDSEGDAEVG